MNQRQLDELIPGLPEEIALECLTRVHYSAHQITSQVCKIWLELLQSGEFYYHRKQTGRTHKLSCLVQAVRVSSETKQTGPPSFLLSVFDPVMGNWDRIDPIPKYPNGLPLFCQITSSEGKIFIMGGCNPSSWEVVKDIFMYDFATRTWTQCADLPSNCSFFAVGAMEGRIFIAGGHDENKNALNSAWVFDIKKNEWTELPRMSEDRDECEGIVIGSEFWVVSGYDTENQGRFKNNAEVFDPAKGEWRRVEDAWMVNQCPRSCVGVGKDGRLTSWTEFDPEVRVGVCGVDLGDRLVVTGSAYHGAPREVFVAEKSNEGQIGKLIKTQVPDGFSGHVQSGCCVEI